MKINIGERMSPCEQLWAESEDRHTFAMTSGVEASLDDSSAEEPDEEAKPKSKPAKRIKRHYADV